jgi:hypothetical protein
LIPATGQKEAQVTDAAATTDETFRWRDLAERIGDYLCREGVPAAQAAQLSQAVIRMCADAADSMHRAQVGAEAMDEARTLLETWQVNRREQMLTGI